MKDSANHFLLRNLSLASRLVVAAFLVSVGFGYLLALVQLHVQRATPGRLLPGTDETASTYYGRTGMSQFERHVHLLGLATLYGLTGLVVTLTSYRAWLRGPLGLLPLTAQVVEIGCWWLGRVDPLYAKAIVFTGAAAGLGLFLQIGLSLFDLFGKAGRMVLVILILAACVGGYVTKERVIDPYLAKETMSATVDE